jgi:hypothetical protein
MEKGQSYSLIGATDLGRPSFTPAISKNNLFLTNIQKVNTDVSYCQVKLPYPTQFISLRYVKASFEGEVNTSNASQISEVPLLQVLQYDVFDPANLHLDQFPGWEPSRGASIQQLHFFAEPKDIVPDDHALSAFRALVDMFGGVNLRLKAIPGSAACPPPADGNDRLGLFLEQEKSLVERDAGCPGELSGRLESNVKGGGRRKGAQPANCFSVIATAP